MTGQLGQPIDFSAVFYDLDGQPRTDLTVNVIVENTDGTILIPSTSAPRLGIRYTYPLPGASVVTYGYYTAKFTPTDITNVTPPIGIVTENVVQWVGNLDVAVSSRLATAGYTAPDNTTIGTINTNLTALINRVGAFTGTGVNTILGFFKALMGSAASTPSDVGGTFSAATDSTEAIRDEVSAIRSRTDLFTSNTIPAISSPFVDETSTIYVAWGGDYVNGSPLGAFDIGSVVDDLDLVGILSITLSVKRQDARQGSKPLLQIEGAAISATSARFAPTAAASQTTALPPGTYLFDCWAWNGTYNTPFRTGTYVVTGTVTPPTTT